MNRRGVTQNGWCQEHRRTALCAALKPGFTGRCLNEEVFATLAEARAVIERWRIDYNHVRPHSAHGGLTPEAVRLNPAAVRLRNLISSAARPLPSAKQIGYQPPGLS